MKATFLSHAADLKAHSSVVSATDETAASSYPQQRRTKQKIEKQRLLLLKHTVNLAGERSQQVGVGILKGFTCDSPEAFSSARKDEFK